MVKAITGLVNAPEQEGFGERPPTRPSLGGDLVVESNVRYPRENVEYQTEVRPSPDQMMGCRGNAVCRV